MSNNLSHFKKAVHLFSLSLTWYSCLFSVSSVLFNVSVISLQMVRGLWCWIFKIVKTMVLCISGMWSKVKCYLNVQSIGHSLNSLNIISYDCDLYWPDLFIHAVRSTSISQYSYLLLSFVVFFLTVCSLTHSGINSACCCCNLQNMPRYNCTVAIKWNQISLCTLSKMS